MNDFSRNRSFKFGDGLFETLRVMDAEVVFSEAHFERLSRGFDILSFDRPEGFSSEWLELQILNFIKVHHAANLTSCRVRITFWRESPGFFYPERNTINWIIESYPLSQAHFVLNESGMEIGIYRDVIISPDILCGIKSCSSLSYVMAALHKQKMGWDDALLLNSNGGLVEASSSNLFILKNKQLFTPSAAEGPLPGVCRKIIIESAHELGLELIEGHIKPEDLYHADEIWLSNVVSGVRWVNKLAGIDMNLGFKFASEMTDVLNRKAKSSVLK